jgi:hypothetical protein
MMMKGGGWPWGNEFCQVAVLCGEAAAKQGWRGRESALAEPPRLMRHGGAVSSGGLQHMATMTRAMTMMMRGGCKGAAANSKFLISGFVGHPKQGNWATISKKVTFLNGMECFTETLTH